MDYNNEFFSSKPVAQWSCPIGMGWSHGNPITHRSSVMGGHWRRNHQKNGEKFGQDWPIIVSVLLVSTEA